MTKRNVPGVVMIELRVEDAGTVILTYSFPNIEQASEMFFFLRDFFPTGCFIIQPLRH